MTRSRRRFPQLIKEFYALSEPFYGVSLLQTP
jgi:hypothetical protein